MSGHAHAKRAPLRTALALTLIVAALELAGGLASRSLALLADSAHVLMDAVALGIALAAALAAKRPATERQSYGFARFEILAALANGAVLLAVAALIGFAAVARIGAQAAPQGGLMAAVAALGFVLNGGICIALVRSAHGNLNVRAVVWHVAGDLAGEAAVVVGGLAIWATGLAWIDPVLSLVVVAIIVAGVAAIVREASTVLLQSAPDHAPIPEVRARMQRIAGVTGVHDLHVWTMGAGRHVLSAHVLLADARISEATTILRALESMLHDAFAIEHVTIQFECDACDESDRIVCTQAPEAAAREG